MGVLLVFGKLLVAVYHVRSESSALHTTATLATASGAVARVLHVREGDCAHGFPYLVSADEAWDVVNEAVFDLRMAGIGASGQVRRSRIGHAGDAILEEAWEWQADAIVVGTGRPTLLNRFPWRRTVTDRLRQGSAVPVIVAPPTSAVIAAGERAMRLLPTGE